jgi:exodeoxyribonuclease (lambda-induced)
MKIHNHEQGTDEWFAARLGKITASQLDKLITRTGKPSAQVDDLINQAVAELLTGERHEIYQTEAMLRGKALEDQALEFFNFTHGYNFEKVGFIDTEKGYGCSPDGIDTRASLGLELKVPLAHTHVGYLVSGVLPDKYWQQVQGSLAMTGLERWVFGSYHPQMPCLCIVVERDWDYCKKLRELLESTAAEIQTRYNKIKNLMEE